MGSNPITRLYPNNNVMLSNGRFLISVGRRENQHLWKRKKGKKLRNQRKGIKKKIFIRKNLREKKFPVLADFWRESQKNEYSYRYKSPWVEGRLSGIAGSYYYLQSGLKKDVALKQDKYYVSTGLGAWSRLSSLDLQISCLRESRANYRFKRWFLENRYLRKKVGRLVSYYEKSLWRKYQMERIREESPKYVSHILQGGILVQWNQVQGRLSSQPDWQVHNTNYFQKRRLMKEFLRKDLSKVKPRIWLRRPEYLLKWSHAQFLLQKRPRRFRRIKSLKIRKMIRGPKRKGLFWKKGSRRLIFRLSGLVSKIPQIRFKQEPYDLKGMVYVRKRELPELPLDEEIFLDDPDTLERMKEYFDIVNQARKRELLYRKKRNLKQKNFYLKLKKKVQQRKCHN